MENVGDVLIVGAGPVGLLTALALAQRDIRVTVMEAGDALSDAPRAAVYAAPTLLALDDLGILPDVDAVSCRGGGIAQRVPEFDFEAIVSNAVQENEPYNYQLHCGQDLIGRIAMDHAMKLGAEVRFSHRLTDFKQDADGITALVETPGGERQIRAGWIIGADGARSTVRKLMGAEFAGFTWPNRFVATNVYCDFSRFGYAAANFVCDPEYMAVVAVISKDGLWRVTYQESGDLPVETYLERLPERYAHIMPPGAEFDIEATNPYTLHQRAAASLRSGRALLAGDAAHATNPCGGMGLTTGIWTGLVLADVLAAVIRGEEGNSILDRYSGERRRVFWEVTSPQASENKRILEEKDLEQRRKDMAAFKAVADDPQLSAKMLAFPYMVIGDTLRANSRWAGAGREQLELLMR